MPATHTPQLLSIFNLKATSWGTCRDPFPSQQSGILPVWTKFKSVTYHIFWCYRVIWDTRHRFQLYLSIKLFTSIITLQWKNLTVYLKITSSWTLESMRLSETFWQSLENKVLQLQIYLSKELGYTQGIHLLPVLYYKRFNFCVCSLLHTEQQYHESCSAIYVPQIQLLLY